MDILELLENLTVDPHQQAIIDAAVDEIERLRQQNAELVEAAKVVENKLEIREGQLRGAFGQLIRTCQQNIELVEALEIAADGFKDCGAKDLEDMCRATIAKATGGE
jgi:type II secretory pathway component PulF